MELQQELIGSLGVVCAPWHKGGGAGTNAGATGVADGGVRWGLGGILDGLVVALPAVITVGVVVLLLAGVRVILKRQAQGKTDTGFRQELTMFLLSLVGVVAVLLSLPVAPDTRAQLLSLFGLLLSAAIALSSTTFLGNMMAGLMLRAVRSFRTGDFLRVGEHFGRVTERGLLHTELQTEDSDLTTLPNLHLVTVPYSVIRAGGTIVTASVSLGYDVPRRRIEATLLEAAGDIELEKPFVHVTELGDFSVVYRVGGLLKEVKHLLSTRSRLRGRMLDRLHEKGIEIASPTLMSTRAFPTEQAFVPPPERVGAPEATEEGALEEVAFEKADQAATVEELEARAQAIGGEIESAKEAKKKAKDQGEKKALAHEIKHLTLQQERLNLLLERRKQELQEREANGD